MPSFPLLDVAVGLIFVYLLLSLICSSVNEGIESLLRNRANDLEGGIRRLLGDQPGKWWTSFAPWINSIENASITREFYRHPMICNLVRSEKRLPTYIPARNFALAVMDMVGPNGTLLRGATGGRDSALARALPLAEAVNQVAIPEHLKNSIQTLIRAANGDARQARLNIENWFNSSMDRVSGWYKARTQKVLFCIGLVATVVVNADSIAIFRNLSRSKNLQAMVAAAGRAAGEKPVAGQDPQVQIAQAMDQLNALDIGIGWASELDQSGALDRQKLPPSWGGKACKTESWPCEAPIGWTFHLLYMHGIGWLITAAAISLGAPFWFDTLNRFMVVRSTVKPKEKSQDEPSKD